MTTVRRSIPTRATPLTAEQRLARTARRADAAAVVAAAAQTDADTAIVLAGDASTDAAGALLAVDDVVDGTTSFTALKVGGVNVKPFLDNTDGTKLTNAAGLDTGIVSTAKIAANAATVTARYDSTSETDLVAIVGGSDPITSRTTIFSVVMTATGSEIQVSGGFYLRLQHSQDDVVLYVVVERVDSVSGSTDKFLATMQSQAISGDGFFTGWQNINFSDTPAAGLVTYYVRVYHTYSIGSPGGFVTWKHRNRTLGFLETKR